MSVFNGSKRGEPNTTVGSAMTAREASHIMREVAHATGATFKSDLSEHEWLDMCKLLYSQVAPGAPIRWK